MARRWDEGVGVVTPEAVQLQFDEANVGSRAISFFVDAVILGVALLVLNAFLGYLLDDASVFPDWVAIVVALLLNFMLLFGYWVCFETLAHGRTPGKMAMGLRVVTVEGSPVRFRHAAIRAAMGLIDFSLFGFAAILAALFSKRHQRLGDMVAGTVVLRERSAAPPARAAQFRVPDGAEAYAASLDVSGLSPQEYETIREYLMRSHDLPAAARSDIARRLALGIAQKLQHNPPSNVSPDLFLRCAAARYQQRFSGPPAHAPVQPPSARSPEPTSSTPARGPGAEPPPPAQAWEDFAPPS